MSKEKDTLQEVLSLACTVIGRGLLVMNHDTLGFLGSMVLLQPLVQPLLHPHCA